MPEEYLTSYTDREEDGKASLRGSKYEIISKVAYLIGVPKKAFDNEFEPPKMEIYMELEKNKSARIMRNLCVVRASIERWFGKINEKMQYEYKGIFSVPEYIPQQALDQLAIDGVRFDKRSSTKLVHHIIELNKLISDRINNCKTLFPVWLNWDYIKDLFIMQNGLTETGAKDAADVYFQNISCYPYGVYMNWKPQQHGNILFNDRKFVTLLYEWNKDKFTDFAKVSDAGIYVKSSIYEFIGKATKIVMAVDCENSDPYRLCATLKGLEPKVLSKIHKILLIDDVHTVNAWRILESYTTIPVEHVMTQRVKQSKSIVDIELTAITCREHYRDNVDSFILVTSDSDYWGLISSLPDARFLVMIERAKCGPDMRTALTNRGIFYCYIEDFFDGNSESIKKKVLFDEINRTLTDAVRLNVNEMFDQALSATRINMKPAEKRQFLEKHLSQLRLSIDEQGEVAIHLNTK